MKKREVKKVIIDNSVFESIVHACGSSINKLGASKEVECTDRTLYRLLAQGKMRPHYLDQIAKYLDVDPNLLCGEYHRQAKAIDNPIIRECVLRQLIPENYPYFRKQQQKLNETPMDDLLEHILSWFEISREQYEGMDFESQYMFQHDMLNALIPIIRKHFDKGAYGRADMPDLERIIDDLENYRENHYLRIFAEEVLRKEFMSDPPKGYSAVDIAKMKTDDLISLDIDRQLDDND